MAHKVVHKYEESVHKSPKGRPGKPYLYGNINLSGTQGRTRTGTSVRTGDFESPASTIPPLGPIDFIGLYNSLSSKYPVLC